MWRGFPARQPPTGPAPPTGREGRRHSMNGSETPTVLHLSPLQPGLTSCKVFNSYANEPEGRRLEGVVRRALLERGCDGASDRDLSTRTPSSLPAWLDDQIKGRVVLCLL